MESSATPVWLVIVSTSPMSASRGGATGNSRVDRQREQPGGQHRVAQQLVVAVRVPVEDDERAGHDDELGGEVEVVEHPQRPRAVEGVLHAGLDVDAERLLELDDRVGVVGGDGDVADGHEAAEAVEEVGGEEQRQLTGPWAAEERHGICTSATRVAVEREATK